MLSSKKLEHLKICHTLLGKIVEQSFMIKGYLYKEPWSLDAKVKVPGDYTYHAHAEVRMEKCPNNSKIEKKTSQVLPLQVLVAGTGRDGTTSLSFLLTEMSFLNGNNKRCIHEYQLIPIIKLLIDYLTTKENKALITLLSNWNTWSVSGTGYGLILPIFHKVFGSRLKIIHLKRNKDAYITSVKKRIFMKERDYLSTDEDKFPTAYHYQEMDKDAWAKLSIEEKVSWFYDKMHASIEKDSTMFENVLQVKTESLNDHQVVKKIANFLNPAWNIIPSATHQNSTGFINHTNFSKEQFNKVSALFDHLNFHRALRDGRYLVQYMARAAAHHSIVTKEEDLKVLHDCLKLLD